MTIWKEILIAFGSNAVLLVVLGFLARSLLNTWIVKDIKQFESDLKARADSDVEELKNRLQLIAAEHQV